jgi:hypothetical protein
MYQNKGREFKHYLHHLPSILIKYLMYWTY